MLSLKSISLRNFMSFGNVAQKINLDTGNITLILGENLDVISNVGNARNGVGKTSINAGICFALFGQSVSNIRKDNLVNYINQKNMETTIVFEKNGIKYRIERGRKPNYFRFFVDDVQVKNKEEKEKDEAQGESKETQLEIERIIGFSCEMYKHIIGLNTNSLPFLSLNAKEQRELIEQLLGITQLSEKAESLKILQKETRDMIISEEMRVKMIKDSNGRITQTINELKTRREDWSKKHSASLSQLITQYNQLLEFDI